MESIIEKIQAGVDTAEIVEKVMTFEADRQEAAINDIAGLKSQRAAEVLASLAQQTQDKRTRKLINRALFHLKTIGIRYQEPETTEAPSALKRIEEHRESKAFLSNYDADQTRAILAAIETKKNQFLLIQAVTHFSHGLLQLASFSAPRSKLDPILGNFLEKTHHPTVVAPVSASFAGYLIDEASRISGKESDEARNVFRLLQGAKGEVNKPADIYRLPTPGGTSASSFASVLGDDFFESFLFSWPGMEEDRTRLADAVNPSLVLPPHVIQERREAYLKTLVQDERVAANAASFKRMLEDCGYMFYCLKQFAHYKGLMEILQAPQSTVAAMVYFIQKTLAELDRQQQQEQASNILIDPRSLTKK